MGADSSLLIGKSVSDMIEHFLATKQIAQASKMQTMFKVPAKRYGSHSVLFKLSINDAEGSGTYKSKFMLERISGLHYILWLMKCSLERRSVFWYDSRWIGRRRLLSATYRLLKHVLLPTTSAKRFDTSNYWVILLSEWSGCAILEGRDTCFAKAVSFNIQKTLKVGGRGQVSYCQSWRWCVANDSG